MSNLENIRESLAKGDAVIKYGDVEVGHSYPLYGMITKIIDDRPGRVVAELNYGSIIAEFRIPEADRIELLKARAFEPGIFVSTVKQVTPQIRVECSTVIFGKRNTEYAA
jgi:hypothetical protein